MNRLLEATGLLLILFSWGFSWWSIDKYSDISSSLEQEVSKVDSYHYHMAGVLLNRLEDSLIYTAKPKKKHNMDNNIFMFYEVSRITDAQWENPILRKKWLDVVIELADYIKIKASLIKKYEKQYDLPNNKKNEEALLSAEKIGDRTLELLNYEKTNENGIPFLDITDFDANKATILQRNLTIEVVNELMPEAYIFTQNSINEKKATTLFLILFILGSVLIFFAKAYEYYKHKKYNKI